MTRKQPSGPSFGIANMLSCFRLVAVPFLLYLAWTGKPNSFLILLGFSFFSDLIDGSVARLLNQTSELGAKLDSWGDLATYLTIPICAWWLWPDILKREAFYVLYIIIAYSVPLLTGLLKFGKLPSYHTWAAKASMIILSTTAVTLILTGVSWPFHLAAIAQGLVALEEMIITLRLPQPRSNVRSLLHINSLINSENGGKR